MTTYQGTKAVITGGTTGIGLATARALIDGGAEVMLTGRTEQHLNDARRALGPRAHVVRSDAGSVRDIDALAAAARETLGALDLVFINAGYCKLEPFAEVTEAVYDETFAVNTRGAFFAAQRLAPLVRDGGALVFTTSVADEIGFPTISAYSGAKAAVRGFARVLAAELLPRRIRVNAVSGGFIRTPNMGLTGTPEGVVAAFEKEGAELTPMKRIASAEEFARAVLFLAFEATFTTGEELLVDGGLVRLKLPA